MKVLAVIQKINPNLMTHFWHDESVFEVLSIQARKYIKVGIIDEAGWGISFILHILVCLYANIEQRTAKMSLSSYLLILTFSLLSQGIFLSASKSIRNLEDDMVFNTFRLGKAFQKEDTAEKSVVAPSLEQYKNDEGSFMNDEENKNSKVSGNITYPLFQCIFEWFLWII